MAQFGNLQVISVQITHNNGRHLSAIATFVFFFSFRLEPKGASCDTCDNQHLTFPPICDTSRRERTRAAGDNDMTLITSTKLFYERQSNGHKHEGLTEASHPTACNSISKNNACGLCSESAFAFVRLSVSTWVVS